MKLNKEIQSHLIPSEAPIREAIIKLLATPFNTVLEELDVELGKARIDVALIGDRLHGVELKSDGDNLIRLPNQINHYSQVFDKMTIIVGYSHIYNVMEMVPDWWGVTVVEKSKEENVCFTKIRNSKLNTQQSSLALTNLLTRWETLGILTEVNNVKGYRSRPNHTIREHLAMSMDINELKFHVKKTLIARTNRKVGVL